MPKHTPTTPVESSKDSKKQKIIRARQKIALEKPEVEITSYTQNVIPIDTIVNGTIMTKDGRLLKILEVEPINFDLISDAEKANIIDSFTGLLRIPKLDSLQIKIVTKQADSQRYIDIIKKDSKGITHPKLKEVTQANIELIRSITAQAALSRRFFIIYETSRQSGLLGTKTDGEMLNDLEEIKSGICNRLSQCGNNVKLFDRDHEIEFLYEMFYLIFNRRSSINEPYNVRIARLLEDQQKAMNMSLDEIPGLPFEDVVAPRGIDLSHPQYMVMDGLYYTYLYISGDKDGYPTRVGPGWVNQFLVYGNGVDVDIYLRKRNREVAKQEVAQRNRLNITSYRASQEQQYNHDTLKASLESGTYIKYMLNNNHDLYDMHIMLTITETNKKRLLAKRDTIASDLISNSYKAIKTSFLQQQCFESSMPLNYLDKNIAKRTRRNIVSYDLAAIYPFTAYEICDDDGILLGINSMNHSLSVVDIFNTQVYKNANMVILGTSGSGKSFTEQLMAIRMTLKKIQTFIIAPLKGHEFLRTAEALGGSFVRLSPSSPHCINILEIREKAESLSDLLDATNTQLGEQSLLRRKIPQIMTFCRLLFGEINLDQERILDEAIIQTYKNKGITFENSSLIDPKTNRYKEMPILGDLYEQLSTYQNDETARELRNGLQVLVSGSYSNFNQQTNVNLDNIYTVLDISELSNRYLAAGMFIALDFCWDEIKSDRTRRKAIFLDEIWRLIGADSNEHAAKFVLEIFKIIRGYGGSAIAATQDISDFFSLENGKYGRGIINNSKIKLILNLEEPELKELKGVIDLSKREQRSILNFETGQALMSANNNKVAIQIVASTLETEIITSDPNQQRQIGERLRQQKNIEAHRQLTHNNTQEETHQYDN